MLFTAYDPNENADFLSAINPNSLVVKKNVKINTNLLKLNHLDKVQFERLGYFSVDYDTDNTKKRMVFNRTVTLVDQRAKIEKKKLGVNE